MYAGHAALAVLAKGLRPRIPIALLVPVAFGPDIVEWLLEGAKEGNRMLSHSLPSVAICATLVAVVYRVASRARSNGDALAVWLTYVSHWPADFITGMKPTWPGGPTVGLLVYHTPVADFLIESLLIILCWMSYRRSLPRERRNGVLSAAVPAGLIAMQIAFGLIQNPVIKAPIREALTRLYQ